MQVRALLTQGKTLRTEALCGTKQPPLERRCSFDLGHDTGINLFVQARHGNHNRRLNFRHIAQQRRHILGIGDLRAAGRGQEMADGALKGMREGQE